MQGLDFLPFVSPATDPTLPEIDFAVAVDAWNESLSKLLKLDQGPFWHQVTNNASLSRFLNSFLGEYAQFLGNKGDSWPMDLEEIVRRVFMVYLRIAHTVETSEAFQAVRDLPDRPAFDAQAVGEKTDEFVGDVLQDLQILSIPVMLDIAGIYTRSDPDLVAVLINALFEKIPSLMSEFSAMTGTVAQIIRRTQKKYEKGSGGGKGKGKGKGVSPRDSPDPNALTLVSPEDVAEANQHAAVLSSILVALESIASVSPAAALQLQSNDSFFASLTGCYNYTLPALWKILVQGAPESEEAFSNDWNGSKGRSMLQNLRMTMLAIVNDTITAMYSQSLDDMTGPNEFLRLADLSQDISAEAQTSLSEDLCAFLIELYESVPVVDQVYSMVNAPLILDLEVEFGISQKLSTIVQKVFKGDNDRIRNISSTLFNLRQYNISDGTSITEARNLRKTERLARKLSDMYLSEDKDRSTLSIGSEQSHVTVAPMTNVQEDEYVKRTLLISQVQDIFPDMGDGFLEACLKTFGDDPEVVIMKLLEEDLPASLVTMDRSTARSLPHQVETAVVLAERISTPEPDVLSTRRNIFDGDAFDMFSNNVTVDKSLVSRGKKGPKNAEVVLDDKSFVTAHKSAILEAVENMYDDEYDDTYDSMGLSSGATDFKLVDDSNVDNEDSTTPASAAATASSRRSAASAGGQVMVDPSVQHEEVLIKMFTSEKDKVVFNRNGEARRSKKRQELKALTKMSDEQLEGWAIMFARNPRKQALALKYEFNGAQDEIAEAEPVDKRRGGRLPFVEKKPTMPLLSPQQSKQKSNTTSGSAGSGQSKQNQQGQQGQQGQQQPKTQSQAPPTPDARQRAKNEKQKSSKANHNRRAQHAKKTAFMNP